MMSSASSIVAPFQPVDTFDTGWRVAPPRRVAIRQRVFNPYLLAIALIYLAWSYFHLSSSIWGRLVFASYLIWRMRPDVILPYCLSCWQLRLNLSLGDSATGDGLEDVYESLTGFESFAFAIPPALLAVRTTLAMFDVRANRAALPPIVSTLWLLGGVLIVAGAIYAKTNGYGWAASMRMYAVVGSCFYGMLMPRLDERGLNQLAGGLAFLGFLLLTGALYSIYGSQMLFMLSPLVGVWAISGLLSRETPLYSMVLLAVSGAYCLLCSTFMLMLTWLWCAIAACWEQVASKARGSAYKRIHVAILLSFVLCLVVFAMGFVLHTEEKAEADNTVIGRIEGKLYKDRGPLWVGFVRSMYEEPLILPVPGRVFMIRSFGKDTLWRNGPHNIVLELLRQMGLVCGPICVAVLAALLIRLTRVIARDTGRGCRAIATATISAVMVGGVTLPFMLADRQGEVLLMAAGLAVGSCWRVRSAPRPQWA